MTLLSKIARHVVPLSGNLIGRRTLSTGSFKTLHDPQGRKERKPLKIGLQGAPFCKGQQKPGVEEGPTFIRNSGLVKFLREEVGHDVMDYGDVQFPQKGDATSYVAPTGVQLKNYYDVASANKLIAESTSKILRDGRICLTLGGDHSIAIGTIEGVGSVVENFGVLWIDAHTDINTALTTGSGNMHGMGVAFHLKELQKDVEPLSQFSWVTPRISSSRIAYIGLRSVDSSEREILDQLGIAAFDMKDIDRLGIINVTNQALNSLNPSNQAPLPLHISFDIDVLDDIEIGTATGTPVPGGLTLREGLTLLEEVHDRADIISFDLVEVNPKLATLEAQKRVGDITKRLLGSVFGFRRGGHRLVT